MQEPTAHGQLVVAGHKAVGWSPKATFKNTHGRPRPARNAPDTQPYGLLKWRHRWPTAKQCVVDDVTTYDHCHAESLWHH